MIKFYFHYIFLFFSHILVMALQLGGSSTYTKNIFLIQKRAIRAISGLGYSDSTADSFKKFKILTLEKLYQSKLAALMWDFDHSGLPNHLRKLFNYSSEVHSFNTRSVSKANLAQNTGFKTNIGSKMLSCTGPKVLNSLKLLPFYDTSHTKHSFLAKYNTYLLDLFCQNYSMISSVLVLSCPIIICNCYVSIIIFCSVHSFSQQLSGTKLSFITSLFGSKCFSLVSYKGSSIISLASWVIPCHQFALVKNILSKIAIILFIFIYF